MRLLSLIFWLMICFNGFSQYRTILDETFKNNKNNWLLSSGGDLKAVIKDGQYSVEYSGIGMATCVTSLKQFSNNDDYILSTKIKQISGDDNQGFGIVLGQKDIKNYYAFTISRQGLASIYEFSKGSYHVIENWTETEVLPNGL